MGLNQVNILKIRLLVQKVDKVEDEIQSDWTEFKNEQSLNITMSKAALYLLIDEVGKGCECGGKWVVDLENSHDIGHVHSLKMNCDNTSCEKTCKWNSSKKFSDGTYDINRRAVASWILTGGQGQDKYIEFMKVWGVGYIPKTSWFRYQKQLVGCVSDEALTTFQAVIDEENKRVQVDSQESGSVITLDVQWSCQPHNNQRANEATATVINQENQKIIGQFSVSKDDLVNANGIKCLDKLSTQKALSHLGEALDSIWQVVTDGCGSAAKSVHDIIQANEKHNEAIVQKDVWHKAKSLLLLLLCPLCFVASEFQRA